MESKLAKIEDLDIINDVYKKAIENIWRMGI